MENNFFEKHKKSTMFCVWIFVFALMFGILKLNVWNVYRRDGKHHSLWEWIVYRNVLTMRLQDVEPALCDRGLRYIKLKEFERNLDHKVNPKELYGETIFPTLEYKDYKTRTDENGFLLPAKVHEDPDLNLVFIGGSTTECWFVEEELRFPYLTGRKLESLTGKKVNSYNAGRSGMHSRNAVEILLNKLPSTGIKFDMAVFMENINDVTSLFYDESYFGGARSVITCSEDGILGNDEFGKSRNKDHDLSEARVIKMAELYKENLKLFLEIARIYNIKPIFMTQFNRIDDVKVWDNSAEKNFMRRVHKKFSEVMRKFAKENGVILIDLAKKIPHDEKYIYDQVHLNNEGSKLVANEISNELMKYVK